MNLRLTLFLVVTLAALGVIGSLGYKRFFFRSEIADKLMLVQVPFELVYNIESNSEVVVKNVFGWVVSPHWVIGSCESTHYFAIDRSSGVSQTFSDLSLFNAFLIANGMPRYDLSNEENVSHLKYGSRKYGPAKK